MLTQAAAMLVLSACSGRTTTTVPLPAAAPQQAPDAIAGRSASAGGAGGARAGAGAIGRAGSSEPATPDEPLGLACGPVTCPQPLNLVGNLLREALGVMTSLPPTSACCLDSEQGICGTIEAGGMCEPAAKPDPKCPGIDLSALVAIVGGLGKGTANGKSGCCTHNACGIDGEIFGRGCIRNEEMSQVIKSLPVVGPLIVVPGAVDCVSPGELDPDAPDAGS